MKKILFLVCPFSQSEAFIKKTFTGSHLYMTGMGGYLNFQDEKFADALTRIIIKEKIEAIHLVQNTDCRFIHEVLSENKNLEYPVQNTLKKLLSENEPQIKSMDSKHQMTIHLASLMIKEVSANIHKSDLLKETIKNKKIEINGTLIQPKANKLSSFNLNQPSILA